MENSIFHFYRISRRTWLINLLSLAIGFTCVFLILMWMVSEVGTDRFHSQADHIAVVYGVYGKEGKGGKMEHCPPALAPALKREMPEVKTAARMYRAASVLYYDKEKFNISSDYCDADLFRIFDMPIQEGKCWEAGEVNCCVISQKAAALISPSASPVGKQLEVGDEPYLICGIIRDLPSNSTLDCDILIPVEQFSKRFGEGILDIWFNNSFTTYLLLEEHTRPDDFSRKIRDRVNQENPEQEFSLGVYALKDRYLVEYGHWKYVGVVGLIALLLLSVACINFVNLTTAYFSHGASHTAIRKILGAGRGQLVVSHLLSTLRLAVPAFLVAACAAYVLIPSFNAVVGKQFTGIEFFSPWVWGISVGVMITAALLAGIYPAFYLSSFSPLAAMQGKNTAAYSGTKFRNILVGIQFFVAIVLLVSTFIISRQVELFRQADLGYRQGEVAYIPLDSRSRGKAIVLKNELLKNRQVFAVSLAGGLPLEVSGYLSDISWTGKNDSRKPVVYTLITDGDWAKVMGIKFREGGFFGEGRQGVVINGSFAALLGDTVTGKKINGLPVAGVLGHFLYNDFKIRQEPLMIMQMNEEEALFSADYLMLRIGGSDLSGTLERIKESGHQLNGGFPVEVGFLNDRVEKSLQDEKQISRLVSLFAGVAIFVSCLGLYGLTVFVIERKRREVGIRRVNGARIWDIICLLNQNLLLPVVIAFGAAVPVTSILMARWMSGFELRAGISWDSFILSGGILMLFIGITITYQTWKAASGNPVDSLREK